MRLVTRTRPAGGRPLLELRNELVVRYRHWCPVAARVPAPEHQLVLADVRDKRREVAAAIALLVLDRLAERARRETDPRHLVVRRRQAPMRRARRRVRAVARRGVRFAVAGRTLEAGRPVSRGTAHHTHRVRQARVELEGRVARDVAVLTARVLEHLAHGGEGGDGLGALRRLKTAAGGERERQRRGHERKAHGRLRHAFGRSGSSRSRCPVSAATALATAGAIGGTPTSPIPPGFSVLGTMCTSTTGISFIRRTL